MVPYVYSGIRHSGEGDNGSLAASGAQVRFIPGNEIEVFIPMPFQNKTREPVQLRTVTGLNDHLVVPHPARSCRSLHLKARDLTSWSGQGTDVLVFGPCRFLQYFEICREKLAPWHHVPYNKPNISKSLP